jgi:hypothetical protein
MPKYLLLKDTPPGNALHEPLPPDAVPRVLSGQLKPGWFEQPMYCL